jgi:hypothetical protein
LFNILAPIVLLMAASVRLLVGELIVVEWFSSGQVWGIYWHKR